jgi:hypothetical protein
VHQLVSKKIVNIKLHGTTVKKIQYYNFTCGFIWTWNLFFHSNGNIHAEGVREYGVEEFVWG